MANYKKEWNILNYLLCFCISPPLFLLDIFPYQSSTIIIGLSVVIVIFIVIIDRFYITSIKYYILLYCTYPLYTIVVDFILWRNQYYINYARACYLILFMNGISITLYLYNKAKRIKSFLSCFSNYLLVLVLINIISQVLLPNGFVSNYKAVYSVQSTYFLSNFNSFGFVYILAIVMNAMNAFSRKESYKRTIAVGLLEIASLSIINKAQDSFTSLIVVILITTIVILEQFKGRWIINRLIKHIRTIIIMIIVGFLFILLFGSTFISNYLISLGKDFMGLTLRMEIWKNALNEILKSPIFGHGLGKPEFAYSSQWGGLIRTAHNNYLQLLFYDGLVGLILYLRGIYHSIQLCLRSNKRINMIMGIYLGGLLAYLLIFMFEQRPFSFEILCYISIGGFFFKYLCKLED